MSEQRVTYAETEVLMKCKACGVCVPQSACSPGKLGENIVRLMSDEYTSLRYMHLCVMAHNSRQAYGELEAVGRVLRK